VTATVDSLPLIASSIMGKKLAANDDCIVLDVKTGSGAFMKTLEDSRALARAMVDVGKRAGKKTVALITDMDAPLGAAIGNALEVYEALEVLSGRGPRDLRTLCEALAVQMVRLVSGKDEEDARADVRSAISSGRARQSFSQMVRAQGGDVDYVMRPERLLAARCQKEVLAPTDGYVVKMDTEACGVASLLLGAGRNRMEDVIDPWAGILLSAKTGDRVRRGEVLATLYASDEDLFARAEQTLLSAYTFGAQRAEERPLIWETVE